MFLRFVECNYLIVFFLIQTAESKENTPTSSNWGFIFIFFVSKTRKRLFRKREWGREIELKKERMDSTNNNIIFIVNSL